MNDRMNNFVTNDHTRPDAPRCACAEDLIACLYGEATETEANDFNLHLSACDACRDELAAFGGVREAIGAWRGEALAVLPALAHGRTVAASPEATHARGRSALTALREFFALSPLWLRAGSVAAVLSVCALAALTFARAEARWDAGGLAVRLGAGERVVTDSAGATAPAGVSQERVDEMLAAHRRELEALRGQLREQQEARTDYVSAAAVVSSKKNAVPRAPASSDKIAQSRTARQQDAANGGPRRLRRLDVAENRDEEDLPRLYDLLGEVN